MKVNAFSNFFTDQRDLTLYKLLSGKANGLGSPRFNRAIQRNQLAVMERLLIVI